MRMLEQIDYQVAEADVRQVHERPTIVSAGLLPDVLVSAYPDVATPQIGRCLEDVITALDPYCKPMHDPSGAKVFFRGSGGHRIVGQSMTVEWYPPGWKTPKKIWTELTENTDYGLGEVSAARNLVAFVDDADLIIDLGKKQTVFDLKEPVYQALLDHANVLKIEFGIIQYANAQMIQLRFNDAFIVEIGETTRSWQNDGNDCRISVHLPASVTFSGAYITPDMNVLVDDMSQQSLISDRALLSFIDSSLPKVLISLLRNMQTRQWYAGAIPNLRSDEGLQGGVSITDMVRRQIFWERAKAKSLSSPTQRQIVEVRRSEITEALLLMITMNPGVIYDEFVQYHILEQLHIGRILPPNFVLEYDKEDYDHKFRNGTLRAEESGIVLLANQLHIPVRNAVANFDLTIPKPKNRKNLERKPEVLYTHTFTC